MLPTSRSHKEYQDFIKSQIQLYYAYGNLKITNSDWRFIEKLWLTDLSNTATFLKNKYGRRGPKPIDPDCMLRSYLLMLLTLQGQSITYWVDELRRTPIFAILSGFEPGKTPGIGTFYDFFARLWNSNSPNIKKHEKWKKRKLKKGKKKGDKSPTTSPNKVARLVKRILKSTSSKKAEQPFDSLYGFFQSEFLSISADAGLLGLMDSLTIAGDGTPVVTSALLRSKAICDCRAQGLENCQHKRFYSQPDCNSGWDSSRELFFNGYHLYMLNASDSPYDLPLYPRLQPASRHDSLSLIVSSVEFSQRFSLGTVKRILLDAAHDATAIYTLFSKNKVEPIIDLNSRKTVNEAIKDSFTLSELGVPICSAGLPMKSNGFDHKKNCHKWRCGNSKGTINTCNNPCSTAKFGRTFLTFLGDNPRLITKTKRNSPEWNFVYKRRTSVERSNKREKVDYKLERGRHRSTKMWYIRILGIMMCQHIDAWHSKNNSAKNKNTLNLKNWLVS